MKNGFIAFGILLLFGCCFAAELPLNDAITRFKTNEDRINTFVNSYGNYTTSGGTTVKTMPQLVSDYTTTGLRYLTKALMDADTTRTNGTKALVYQDSTSANNGYYMWTAGEPSGSWVYLGWFPSDTMTLTNTTHASPSGIIYKDTTPFLHNFNYGNNGTVTTTGYNTFVGLYAGNLTMGSTATSTSEASFNTGIGFNSLRALTTGYSNTCTGFNTCYSLTSGYQNVTFGRSSLYSLTSGYGNTSIGYMSQYSNTTGYRNIALGTESLYTNTTGNYNIGIGYRALYASNGDGHTAVGHQALYRMDAGSSNEAFGYNAGAAITSGAQNTTVGRESMGTASNSITGSNNVAFGYRAMYAVNGSVNASTSIGNQSLSVLTSGNANTVLGYQAANLNTDGSGHTSGGTSVYLGDQARSSANGVANEIVIGSTAYGNGSNSVTLGNASITKTVLRANVGIGTTSPAYPLQVTGTTKTDGAIFAVVSKSSNYTAAANDYLILVSGNTTITLPAAASNTGRVYVIKKVDSSSTTTIIDGNSSETIDGAATVNLTTQYSFRMIQSDGTNWQIISRY